MKILSCESKRKRIAAAAAVAAFVPAASAFVTPSGHGRFAKIATVPSIISPTSLVASTLENPTVSNSTAAFTQTKPESQLVNNAPRKTLDVRIHGTWYDLTGM